MRSVFTAASEEGFSVEILVLASMNRVVDTLISHDNRVRFLLWNPDGTQLGNEKIYINDDRTNPITGIRFNFQHRLATMKHCTFGTFLPYLKQTALNK